MSEQKRIVLVECTFRIPVDFTGWEEELIQFDIEENSCPGTHNVGSALDRHIEEYKEKQCCWACALDGKNKIIDIDYKESNEEVKP